MHPSPQNNPADAVQAVEFTPAFPLLGLYDFVIQALTRERMWRSAMLAELESGHDSVVVDIGCGTGTFLRLLGHRNPRARLIGIDPDERILRLAGAKLGRSGVAVELLRGYLRDVAALLPGQVETATSSLVFHQVPLAEKRAGLAAMFAALSPGGRVVIADYGWQRTRLMRTLFRLVQCIDGFKDTQPNADGILPTLMQAAGFVEVEERHVFATATGSISIYRGIKPDIEG